MIEKTMNVIGWILSKLIEIIRIVTDFSEKRNPISSGIISIIIIISTFTVFGWMAALDISMINIKPLVYGVWMFYVIIFVGLFLVMKSIYDGIDKDLPPDYVFPEFNGVIKIMRSILCATIFNTILIPLNIFVVMIIASSD